MSFTLVAHRVDLTGARSSGALIVTANVPTIIDGDTLVDGHGTFTPDDNGDYIIALPSTSADPGTFGYTVRASFGPGEWLVPAQPDGTTVNLRDFVDVTDLPLPLPATVELLPAGAPVPAPPTPGTLYLRRLA